MKKELLNKLSQPTDGASLAFLRIFYGWIMAIDVIRLYLKGNLETYYFTPTMEFTYFFAPWVGHFSEPVMTTLFLACSPLALCMMLGYRFRITGFLFLVIQTYFFLSNPLNYLNHIYFALILGFLLWVTPSHRIWSLDAVRNRKKGTWPENDSIPRWAIYLILIQMEIMLVSAGLVKLSPEFYEGHPLREWLVKILDYPLFYYEWEIRVAIFLSIATHLLIAPFLLFKKTRLYALGMYAFFHLSNHFIFPGIGVFPFLTFAATTMFLDPSWPRRFLGFFKRQKDKIWPVRIDPQNHKFPHQKLTPFLLSFLCLWIIIQLFLPIRHFLIPGNVHWDRNGNLFAWQMMLISRRFGDGTKFYICANKKDEEATCRKDYRQDSYLSLMPYTQLYMYPDLALQYAHQLAENVKKSGYDEVRVYGVVRKSISGRPYQNYWDPDIDLTKVERSFWKDDFLLPLKYDRPDIPPLKARLKNNLQRKYGYWKEVRHPALLNMDDDYHQMLPQEVYEYRLREIERQKAEK